MYASINVWGRTYPDYHQHPFKDTDIGGDYEPHILGPPLPEPRPMHHPTTGSYIQSSYN